MDRRAKTGPVVCSTTTCTTYLRRYSRLLSELGRLAPQPLTIVIERDGRFPPVACLLDQLDSARAALAAGREAAA